MGGPCRSVLLRRPLARAEPRCRSPTPCLGRGRAPDQSQVFVLSWCREEGLHDFFGVAGEQREVAFSGHEVFGDEWQGPGQDAALLRRHDAIVLAVPDVDPHFDPLERHTPRSGLQCQVVRGTAPSLPERLPNVPVESSRNPERARTSLSAAATLRSTVENTAASRIPGRPTSRRELGLPHASPNFRRPFPVHSRALCSHGSTAAAFQSRHGSARNS